MDRVSQFCFPANTLFMSRVHVAKSLYGALGDKQCCNAAVSSIFNDEVRRIENAVPDINDVRKSFKTGSCPS